MAIMKIECSDDIREIVRMTGYKNIGFSFEMHANSDEYFSCTCGHTCEGNELIEIKGGNITPNEEELIKSSIIEDGPVVYNKENYYGAHICPACGTPIVYDYIDIEEDTCPVRYVPKILQDDERFLAVSVEIYGIEFNRYNLSACVEDCKEDWVLLFDKSVRKLYVVECDYPIYTNCILNKDLQINADGWFIDSDGDAACGDTEILMTYFSNDCVYHNKPIVAMTNGFQEIADIFSKEVGIPLKPTTNSDLDENVASLYTLCNFGYMQDKRIKDLLDSPKAMRDNKDFPEWVIPQGSLRSVREFFENCMAAGVDLNAKTVENAFKINQEELNKIKNILYYKALTESIRQVEEINLSDYSKFMLNRIDTFLWKRIFEVAADYQKDVDTAVRSIIRAKGIAPWKALGIVERVYQYDKENASRIVNLDFPVTKATEAKFNLLQEKFFTIEQYDALAKKPTLDNFYKTIIGESCEN